MKQLLNKLSKPSERGQVIVIIVFAMVGLISAIGLMTDGGILLIEYAKLKRAIDAASIASASQYRRGFVAQDLVDAAQEFLILNDSEADNIVIYRCKRDPETDAVITDVDGTEHDEALCELPRRKLIRVDATRLVQFGFMRVVGIDSGSISASSVGEAASIDMVLVIDNSISMVYETNPTGEDDKIDPSEDPAVCNAAHTCQPMEGIKALAAQFVEDFMFFPYDRVAIVTMTNPTPDIAVIGGVLPRNAYTVLPLDDSESDVLAAIDGIRVFQPGECPFDPDNTTFYGTCRDTCLQAEIDRDVTDPGSPCHLNTAGTFLSDSCTRGPGNDQRVCGSSNIGFALYTGSQEYLRESAGVRDDSFWTLVLLAGGPSNASSPEPVLTVSFTDSDSNGFPDDPEYWGFCPTGTTLRCRDADSNSRHAESDSMYDSDDYARDIADLVANPDSGGGITVFTIGYGALLQTNTAGGAPLLEYIAESAGGASANHGFYQDAAVLSDLGPVFEEIGKYIFTKLSQ
jgi:hypothetical protein